METNARSVIVARQAGWPLAAGLAILFLAVRGDAQEQRGSIEGRVLDTAGNPVAGVNVVATSGGGATVRDATDAYGIYRFPSLLPGRWALLARSKDLTLGRVQGIELLLGQILTIDLKVDLIKGAEAVEVSAEAPLLDVRQSGRSFDLRSESIEKLPRGRTFTSLVTLGPGANSEPRQWGLSIDGATSAENRYVIDGAETTDPVSGGAFAALVVAGTPQTLVLNDFLEEIQVKTAGYAAEYGGSTGSVVNLVTRSGTGDWHGDAALYYNADGLTGGDRPVLDLDPLDISRARYTAFPKDRFDRWEPGFSLGGPILKNKLWFFLGYHPSFLTTARTVTFIDESVETREQRVRVDDAVANLTGQLGNRLRFRLAYNLRDQTFDSFLPFHEFDDPLLDHDWDSHQTSDAVSAVIDFVATKTFFVSLHGGWSRANAYDTKSFEGPFFVFLTPNIGLEGVPEELQRPAFFTTEDNSSLERNIRGRFSLQLDGTYFLAAAGQHQIKAGLQWSRVSQDVLNGSSGNIFQIYWDQSFAGQRGPFGYYQVFGNDVFPERGDIFQGDVKSDTLGLFIQDSWTIGQRLTLNVGLRTENEKIPSYASNPRIPSTALAFGFGDKVAPRAGFAWDVKGDGKWKAYGSWGLYHDITKLSLPSAYFGGVKANLRWFTLDTADWPNLDRPGCPPDCPGELILGPIDLAFLANDPEASLIDPAIEPMRLREWSFGLERQLGPQISAGLRYLHRKVDVAIDDVGAVDEAGSDILVIGNPGRGRASLAHVYPDGSKVAYPEPERSYQAVELTVEKRPADRWSGRFSYVWSRLSGNYSGLTDSEFLSAASPNLSRNFDHPFTLFEQTGQPSFGPLGTHRAHHVKLQLVYDFPFGTSAGLHWAGLSGIPRTRQADFIPGLSVPVQYLGRGSDGRMGFIHETSLYLQHEVKLGKRARLAFGVNVLNLFDQDAPTDYFPFELFFGQAVDIGGDEFFRGFDTRALIEELELVRDPRFLQDSRFQPPRDIRLSIRLAF